MKIYRISGGDMAHDVELGYLADETKAKQLADEVTIWVETWHSENAIREQQTIRPPSQRSMWPQHFIDAGLKAPWSNIVGHVLVEEINVTV